MDPIVIRICIRQVISNLLWTGTLFIGGSIAGLVPGGGLKFLGIIACIAGLIGLLINLFRLVNRSPRLILSEQGIVIPKFSKDLIPWTELDECEFAIKRNNNGVIVSATLLLQTIENDQPRDIAVSIEGLELPPNAIRTKIEQLGGFA